jgi:hypothetical protein
VRRIRILLVVCMLVVSGGAAWAQPASVEDGASWGSWSRWVEAAKVWLSGLWSGGSSELSPEAETRAVTVGEPAGVETMDGETCTDPTKLWQGCAPDPNG